MFEVPLYGKKCAGRVALIDDIDIDLVMAYRWYGYHDDRTVNDNWYAAHRPYTPGIGLGKTIYMHRLVLGATDMVDHINHNGLDNRRANLRCVNNTQNQWNRQGNCVSTTSRYKGVSLSRAGRWYVRCCAHGKVSYGGCFNDEIEAALAYDELARELHGEYACLNFPDRVLLSV